MRGVFINLINSSLSELSFEKLKLNIILLLLLISLPSVSLASWRIEAIDSAGDLGYGTSIGVDSNNRVHISYYDRTNATLKYATNVSGSWVITTIDNIGSYVTYPSSINTSIALDSNNKVHISYYHGVLKYATNDSGTWVTYTIDNAPSVGMFSSIVADSNNKVHICYSGNRLRYATNQSGAWVITTIDPVLGINNGTPYNAIAVDSNNKIHISYYNSNDEIAYATNASGGWVITPIENISISAYVNSIAIDSNNKAHMSYIRSLTDGSNDHVLKYATNSSGTWTIYDVDKQHPIDSNSIAVDSNNKIHISYLSGFNLQYATNASGQWLILTLDSRSNAGESCSVAVDSHNFPHISYSYRAATNFNLKYATSAPVVYLPKTGQTTSYAAGDDGSIRAGVAWPSPRFTDNGDQTVMDNLTGLIWTKNAGTPTVGSCTGGTMTWQAALDYVVCLNSLNSGAGYLGHNDWRLPNVNEFDSVFNTGPSDPATWLNGQGFNSVYWYGYWSSTSFADNGWEDCTVSVDTVNKSITGQVTSLSPFGIGDPVILQAQIPI